MRRLQLKVLLPALLISSLTACQPASTVADDAETATTSHRAAVDALDRKTADARKSRISNLRYDLFIDLSASTSEFMGQVLIEFELSDAASDLTLDFNGGTLHGVKVNNADVEPDYNGFFITLPHESLAVGTNSIEVAYSRPYGHDGTGLHRFVDPEDGRTYMHSYLWPYYANRVLPSFDQPSLKAKFKLRVDAPKDWVVVSTTNGSPVASSNETRLWTFAETPKLSTYFFSLHAGEYQIWSDDTGDVPLRLFARQSLAKYVAVEEWFELTQNGMTYFNDYFDIPYPFAKYDQLIVPEFNIGGMENAAAVTYTERYVQRQASNYAERESRASTILHELAHMWFGDLVTHDWWNGMWLNESFATQMATLALMDTTEFDDQWHAFFLDGKTSAYQRDSRVTTHPIEMPVNSTLQFSELFDSITYNKGGSVLKQLMYRVGAENYRAGVSNYLRENAWGTTELADFIKHQSRASGVDLSGWSDDWLTTPGFNMLSAERVCRNGIIRSVNIKQTAPTAWPLIRTHKTDLALYAPDANGNLAVSSRIPVTIGSEQEEFDVPGDLPCPSLVNPNYDDWTYAQLSISDADAVLLAEDIAMISDPLSRSMYLQALYDKTQAGGMPIADYIRLALKLAESEQNFRVLQQITASLSGSIHMMQRLRPETNAALPRLLDDVEVLGLKRAEYAETQDLKHLWFGLFTSVASSHAAMGTSRALLDGKTVVNGLDISTDIRWQLLTILSRHNAPDIDELLEAEAINDPSDRGQRNLLSARAAMPGFANKKDWVDELQSPNEITNLARQRAVMGYLFPSTQTDVQLELLTTVLSALPKMSRDADSYFLSSYTTSLLRPMCREESAALMQATLDEFSNELNPTALRFLREAHQADVECHALRAVQ
ncbi:MAG: aminopeptidase N [Woeseiaceae bacterium]